MRTTIKIHLFKRVETGPGPYTHKRELKQQLKALWDSVPPKDVKNVRARIRFFKQYGLPLDPFDPEQTKPRDIPSVYVDGTTRDSKHLAVPGSSECRILLQHRVVDKQPRLS